MIVKVVGEIVLLLTLGLLLVSCGSDDPLIASNTLNDDVSLEHYKAQQDKIARVDLGALAKITEDILVSEPNLTEEDLRTRIFEELVRLKESGKEKVLAGPSIAGYDFGLTWAEFWLLLRSPWYIERTNQASDDALAEASRQWPRMDQRNTKADAFRHAYWNILLAKRISLWWAETFTTAHESEEKNLFEKEMDLHNNSTGRAIYAKNKSSSESSLSRTVKNYWYWRVNFSSTSTQYLVYLL